MAIKRKVEKAKRKVKRKTKRTTVTIKRKVKRRAVKEGEIVLKRDENLSLPRVPTLADVEEMVRRYDERRAFAQKQNEAKPEYRAVEQFEAARPTTARKPKNPEEARAWLITVADHVGANLEEYGAHKPPGPAVGPLYAQWLSDVRRLRWFADAVKAFLSEENKKSPGPPEENKKSLGRFLGLERGPGNPGGHRKSGESFELAREMSEQREVTRKTKQGKSVGTSWKKVGRDHGMSDQAARKRAKRASLVRTEVEAKEFVARLKQRHEQKPPQVGKAKARNEALVKEIRAHNRRKR